MSVVIPAASDFQSAADASGQNDCGASTTHGIVVCFDNHAIAAKVAGTIKTVYKDAAASSAGLRSDGNCPVVQIATFNTITA